MTSLSPLLIEAARRDMRPFVGLVHRTEEGRPALPPPHLRDVIFPALMDDSLGHTVIIAPPESAKTTALIAACQWWLGNDPNQHIGYISNTSTQAVKRSKAVRDTIAMDPRYHAIFPGILPDRDKGWAEAEWYLKRQNVGDKDPSFLATGVGGPLLGARLRRGVLDDIADLENMATTLQREKVLDWLRKVFMSRMAPNGRVVMICTRWAMNDPAAWAMEQGWHTIHLDALRSTGESYWPAHWPSHYLVCPNDDHGKEKWCFIDDHGAKRRCKKRELGTRGFVQQYRGQAVDDETSLIKREWWQRYSTLPAGAVKGGHFVDMAHEEKKEADQSVILTLVTDGLNLYIVNVWKGRVEFPELERKVLDTRARVALPIYVEETPGSKPLIQSLKRKVNGVMPWKIEGRSKLARLESVLPIIEAGNVYVPEAAPWVDDFIEECVSFPLGEHDDQVDALTMGLLQFHQPVIRWGVA